MEIRTFRDLIAWQKAMDLCRLLYQITQSMPRDERFGLTMQIRRAAVSVPSNIAEGYARQSTLDYLRFLKTARGSLAEVSTQFELATSLNMISESRPAAQLLVETDRVLQGLIGAIQRKLKPAG